MRSRCCMIFVSAIASFAGCAEVNPALNPEPRRAHLQDNLKSWYGYDTDRLVVAWGAPTGRARLNTGAEVLTYRLTTQMSLPQTSTVSGPNGTSNNLTTDSRTQLVCSVNFVTSVDGKVVESGNVDGNLGACERLVRGNTEGVVAQLRKEGVAGLPKLPTGAPQPELTGVWTIAEVRCIDGAPTPRGQAVLDQVNAGVRSGRSPFQVDFDNKRYLQKNLACVQRGAFTVTPTDGRYSIFYEMGTGENCAPTGGIQRTFELRGDEIVDYNFIGDNLCKAGRFVQIFKRTSGSGSGEQGPIAR